jgi:hypothetical protein
MLLLSGYRLITFVVGLVSFALSRCEMVNLITSPVFPKNPGECIKISTQISGMERPTSSSRKIRERQGSAEINLAGKVEDSKLEVGGWGEVKLITTGRNAGCLLIQPPQKEEE